MIEVDFKDRVPLHPGRIQLIPVEGQENVFDVVRADEPTEGGTPINKATLDSITKSRLTGRYYDLNVVVDNDSVSYTADMMPSMWDVGQRITVQVPSFEFTRIASNTFMGIMCNTILYPTRRYELVYNGSSFDAVEIDASVAIASYLAFVGNVNQNMVDAAFGLRGVGEALAMYAQRNGYNISQFQNLRNLQTIYDVDIKVYSEVIDNVCLYAFIKSSTYATYRFFERIVGATGMSFETQFPFTTSHDIVVTENDLKAPFRISYSLTQTDYKNECFLCLNDVPIASAYHEEYEGETTVEANNVLKKWSDYNITEPGTYKMMFTCETGQYRGSFELFRCRR